MNRRGFTLLEVMIAVAILGLVLTVILSAQGGLAASNRSAANLGAAITAARCKMTEQEEKFLKLGYSELDQIDTDVPCCEDAETNGITCDVRAEKIELPSPSAAAGDGGAGSGALSLGTDSSKGGILGGALGALSGAAGGAGLNLGVDGGGGLQGFGAGMQAQTGLTGLAGATGSASPAEGLLNMVMSIAYPSIKPLMEASIRRVTVIAKWKEGPNARTFSLVQYVTNPQRGGFMDLNADGGGLPMGIPGMVGGAGIPGMVGAPGAAGGIPGMAGGATTGGTK